MGWITYYEVLVPFYDYEEGRRNSVVIKFSKLQDAEILKRRCDKIYNTVHVTECQEEFRRQVFKFLGYHEGEGYIMGLASIFEVNKEQIQ